MTTTEVENYPGFPNGGVSGPDMMMKFKEQAEEFGTVIKSEKITKLDKGEDGLFSLTNSDGSVYKSRAVILATGATARYLGLESEEKYMNKGVSACATCDGALPMFRKKPLALVGGGDTSAEEALFLTRFASKVYHIHRRDKFRMSPIMAARVLAHEKIEVVWDTVVSEVLGDDKRMSGVRLENVKTGEKRDLEAAGLFVAIGHQPNSDLVKDLGVPLTEDGYIIPEGRSTATPVPGLFVAGDVADHVYRQAVTAAGSGCAAAIDATRWLEAQEAQAKM
jgi:thioredoxin reductase (NADPH)